MAPCREYNLIIQPPTIIPWLSDYERSSNVILVNLEADILNNVRTRMDLNVVFRCIPIRRSKHVSADYYIGTSGAVIELSCKNGNITNFTPEASIDVNYTNCTKRMRKASLSLKPGGNPSLTSTLSPLSSISFDSQVETNYSTSFSSSERWLAAQHLGNNLQWMLTLPRGERIVSDFLYGNLVLFAEFDWRKAPRTGTVVVRPSDISFFDNQKRKVNSLAARAMQYIIWRKKIRVPSADGILLNFMYAGV